MPPMKPVKRRSPWAKIAKALKKKPVRRASVTPSGKTTPKPKAYKREYITNERGTYKKKSQKQGEGRTEKSRSDIMKTNYWANKRGKAKARLREKQNIGAAGGSSVKTTPRQKSKRR